MTEPQNAKHLEHLGTLGMRHATDLQGWGDQWMYDEHPQPQCHGIGACLAAHRIRNLIWLKWVDKVNWSKVKLYEMI